MESSNKLSLEELREACLNNFTEGGDLVHQIEPLINSLLTGEKKVTDGERTLSLDEVKAKLESCNPFHMYLEDVQLKNLFFSELDHIKENWKCFKDKPHKQIYTKKEEGLGIMSVFYRFKLP
jgi:hypothetical protein